MFGDYRFKEKKTNASICLVNNNVLKQWESVLKNDTNFKYIVINGTKNLQTQIDIDNHDIILIKNGTCTIKSVKYNIFDYFIEKYDYMYNNLILDDITSKFILNSSFASFNTVILKAHTEKFDLNAEFSDFGIEYKTDPKILDESLSLPICAQYLYIIKRDDDNIIDLLVNIADDEVISAINADVIPKGFGNRKYRSTFDIFSHLLNTNIGSHKEAVAELARFEKALQIANESVDESEPIDIDIISEDKTVDLYTLGLSPKVAPLISKKIEEIKASININMKPLDRLRDNIKHNTCPISYNDLNSAESIIILGCCSVIIDGTCALMIFKTCECPNCRTKLSANNVICLDMKNMGESGIDELMFSEDVRLSARKMDGSITKMDIIDNILNFNFDFRTDEKLLKMNILNGRTDYGFAAKEDRKILVFSHYDQNISNIKLMLDKYKLRYDVLKGTTKEIERTRQRYWADKDDPDSLDLMLINSTRYSMGMDLQNTTDVILYHSIKDVDYLTQVVGRCVRIGQKKNLRLHLILYSNEYKSYKQSQ
jgi:hypothetical protein